jgi:MoaA/NifB/PqqE/SkfB family radical SAM enzyme
MVTYYQAAPMLKLGTYSDVSLAWVWHESPVLDGIRCWLRSLLQRCQECPEYRSRCAGLNFEMEVARQSGHIHENPYCISDVPVPVISDFVRS